MIKQFSFFISLYSLTCKAIFSFKVKVSKGTYIRSLCVDIGQKLGYPALMSNLIRTSSGEFNLEDSYSIDDIREGNYKVINMLEALSRYLIIDANDEVYNLVLNGHPLNPNLVNVDFDSLNEKDLIVIKYDGNLIAIYEKKEDCFKAKRIWK